MSPGRNSSQKEILFFEKHDNYKSDEIKENISSNNNINNNINNKSKFKSYNNKKNS